MRIDGLWLPDETGVMRPAVFGLIEISAREYPAHFLIYVGDSGAAWFTTSGGVGRRVD
ncbi:MAG: hypothetical protein AAB427_12025 [Chloroflexota bacterium]